MPSPRVAILASGGGSTSEVFIRAAASGKIAAEVALVISNNKSAAVFDKVNRLNNELGLKIKSCHISKKTCPPKTNEKVAYGRQTKLEEHTILETLAENKIDIVILLGYMKLVGPSIIKKYGWQPSYKSVYQARMLNTHPGLLPHTKGLFGIHIQQYVLINNKPAGHCIFVVDGEYDDGPVISEHRVAKLREDTPESLFGRVKVSEKKHLAKDINNFIINQQNFLRGNND